MTATTTALGVAGVSAPAPSAGDILRVAAHVVDLIGDERIKAVSMLLLDRVSVRVPDPFHAETAAHLLGLDVLEDFAGDEATGAGAHTQWSGRVRGARVEVWSDLRPGALPAPRPWDWPVLADVTAEAA